MGCVFFFDMGVSKNSGTPKSSVVVGFSIINHPFWGTPIFGNTHINTPHICGTGIFTKHVPYNMVKLWYIFQEHLEKLMRGVIF